ncbi:T9SS type A sorting domain-containing protein [Hymenobacter terricola]|uniref:T9SS type A sorting domain-containing protein n=1 Tax=Hymenobacter terricola TaxID=2819236 RepID=UPI001B3041FB|nr:T9SS type A sorting domain-containing protein [Hymenobacter terricola]
MTASAQQAWRPFRPGLIYSFATSGSPGSSFLLRLDSAYTTVTGDSAWAFNRLLRPFDGTALGGAYAFSTSRRSRNNLFGARLVWQPGTAEFSLESVAEGSYQAALSLRLRPRAAVGSTWAASTTPTLTATLTSRTWQPVSIIPGSPSDSVAIITLSSGQVVRLSRQYGLLAGPRWLVTSNSAPQYEASQLPVPLANSPVYPATLFNMRPGDQFGYAETPQSVGSPPCTSTYTLRIIQTRQVVADSLLYTYRQQARIVNYAIFGCFGTPGAVIGPVQNGRLAFSLRTGQSPQYEALPLLSGEYKALVPQATSLVVGLGISLSAIPSCQAGNAVLAYEQMHSFSTVGGVASYAPVSDGNWFQAFAPQIGVGDTRTYETFLQYSLRTTSGGSVTCGSVANFINLLPTRAAQAASLATLHPNPATDAATLTLATPARPGCALRLTDALGRPVWSATVPTGQTTITVPLAGQPAGLYLLHLSGPNAMANWKLTHE